MQDDWENWEALVSKVGDKVQVALLKEQLVIAHSSMW